MNAIELIAALKGADEETAMELVERLQCGEIDCSVLPTGKDNAVLQAQIWAQEARTQKGIVDEIGKLVGCANDWEMVSAVKAALSANGGEAVPVAWAVFADNGNIRIWGREKPEAFPDAAPLYLAPTVKKSLTVQSDPIGYVDPDSLNDYRAGDRLHMPVYRPDASEEWQSGIPVYLHPAPPSVAVPEAVRDLISGTRSINRAAHHLVRVEGDSEPCFYQRGEWIKWILELADTAENAVSAPSPDHVPDAGKVMPIGYLTNQAVARLQSDKRLNGEHLYAFKPDDLSKFQAVCLAPTVNESLTIEDFNGMCRIVEAVSQMTDGFAIDQCHMDRAREIVQDATRLRTAGDEGEG
ncbi:MAG: hypothetical protein CL539_06105 [Alcanivorax sp.]|uniref:hypothetical protein n=1 Tax=unclassified Alcanivorax TaxID=2638842 RepID=UPI000C9334B0|nr:MULTISPECIES: hypothetical protein [unclassified Alcanivorax]MAC14238.1 hypothetical protein [Alcanivorax sp.]|tara:strand:+ start:129 stop:1187 length:1059 start_codon:yes stop_codon:yes gene_type:complete